MRILCPNVRLRGLDLPRQVAPGTSFPLSVPIVGAWPDRLPGLTGFTGLGACPARHGDWCRAETRAIRLDWNAWYGGAGRPGRELYLVSGSLAC